MPRKCAVSVPDEEQRQELEAVFLQHRSRLRDTAQSIVGVRDAAEDVTQTAYLKVLELSRDIVIRQPVSYCFQVVRHLAIDHRRRIMLESRFLTDESQAQTVSAIGSPERSVIAGEHIALVAKALDSLPTRTRTAFTLYRLNGMTQREIALKLGVSPTMVNFLIRDAVEALKRCRLDFA